MLRNTYDFRICLPTSRTLYDSRYTMYSVPSINVKRRYHFQLRLIETATDKNYENIDTLSNLRKK